nr:tetratricopeptide repeat protein [Candidatus Sigynarchaeota archaeon]
EPWSLMGSMYFNILNVDAAIEAYSEAAARNPNNPDPVFHLGCCWMFKGEVAMAIHVFQQATRLMPNHYPSLVFLQRALFRSGLLKDAQQVEETIAGLVPSMDDYFETGYCATILKDLEIGLKNYNAVLKRNKHNSAAWNNLATIHENKGDFVTATEAYQRAISINPRGFHGWHNLVLIKKHAGNVAGAIDVIKEFIQKFPSSEKGWFMLGVLHLGERNADEAVEAYKHVVDLRPDLYRGWLLLGLSQLLAKDRESTLTSCARVLDLEPRNALARALVEFVKRGIADPASFIASLPEAVQLRDWEDLCNGLDELGWKHVSCAVIAWRRFSERFPHLASAWHGLGRALEKHGDLDGAEGSLKRAIEIQPYAFTTIAALGRVFTKKGNITEAMDLFKHLTSSYPDFLAGWVGMARTCLLAEPPVLDGARIALDKASSMRADDLGVMYARAIHAMRLARVDESLEWLEKVIARDAEVRHEIAGDMAFKSLRENQRFQALTKEE